MQITISSSFRQQAAKAILAIFFFVLVYLLLVALATGLVIGLGYAGLMIIAFRPNFITLVVGGGLVCIGLLIFFFLIKFIFTQNKANLSGFIEIKREDEPDLFAFIDDVVQKVGTRFPKKVYISGEVNASVFYNSGFWSMFLPVRKNLHIGLGLMNTTTVDEFRAILAHEFGHFSQRSMKVGSYVYNVNYILHNMLYDNNSYNKLAGQIAGINNYFTFFVNVGVKAVTGIQFILAKVYTVVNINYLSLSREMEFHADEVAAHVAGVEPIATSLMRAELASHALQTVLGHYEQKISQNLVPQTVFPLQLHIMYSLAADYSLEISNGLPVVTAQMGKRFNKSRLRFENQWASHPENEERISRLRSLNINTAVHPNPQPAFSLLTGHGALQEKASHTLFYGFGHQGALVTEDYTAFCTAYNDAVTKNSLPKKFNSYFNNLDIPCFTHNEITQTVTVTEEELFDETNVDMVYESIALEKDTQTLNHLVNGLITQKTFDYDGIRYKENQAPNLVWELKGTVEKLDQKIKNHNRTILCYYSNLAMETGKSALFFEKYDAYANHKSRFDGYMKIANDLYGMLTFISENTPYDAIYQKLSGVYKKEKEFKEAISTFKSYTNISDYADTELFGLFDRYIESEFKYFEQNRYIDAELEVLFKVIYGFASEINHFLFILKKDFLDLQASLSNDTVTI